jgi:hypothetical protein
MGIGIGAMNLATSAGGGIPTSVPAPAEHRAVVTLADDDAGAQAAPIPAAPAPSPAVVVEVHVDEAEPVSDPEPVYPVIQAGPGPATPVEGAITLIDPLVIER